MEALNSLKQQTEGLTKSAGDTFGNLQKSAQDNISSVQSSVDEFSAKTSETAASSGFMDANGMIAKFGFLILVIIGFLIMLNLGIRLIYYFMSPGRNWVYLVKGMIDGNSFKVISQDPSVSTDIVARSNNENTGIEFTWSVWLRLDGFPTSVTTSYQPVFVKGGGTYNSTGVSSISNGPGLYFSSSNSLRVLMDTVSTSSSPQYIDISNIPIAKWFHIAIRCENKYLDVYVNGIVSYRLNLNNVPLQNYNNVEVCGNGGFVGKLSNLLYYNRGLSIVDINSIVYGGPNTTNGDEGKGVYGGDYISSLWYS